jgi:hypothetical protein
VAGGGRGGGGKGTTMGGRVTGGSVTVGVSIVGRFLCKSAINCCAICADAVAAVSGDEFPSGLGIGTPGTYSVRRLLGRVLVGSR